jgi:hypothetical protein
MADWRTVKRPAGHEEALDKLTEAAALYEAYLEITRPNVYPTPDDVQLDAELELGDRDQPVGIIMNPSPMGIALYRTS